MNILLATQNAHKIQEISSILSDFCNIAVPKESLDIPEGDQSYVANAILKAEAWAELYPDYWILADDSGLEVPAINNEPGVISAEYAGKNASHKEHIDKLLSKLKNTADREGVFVSYVLLMSPDKKIFCSRGECHGRILEAPSGNGGFGYDPVFQPEGFDCSMAELSPEQKNQISHRYKALLGIKDYIKYLEAQND